MMKNKNLTGPTEQQLKELLEHYRKKRFFDAEKLAVSISEKYPNHPVAYKVLGAVFGSTGRNDKALDIYQTVLSLYPDDAESHCNLGNILRALGRLDKAKESYEKAINLKPDFAFAHNNLGNIFESLGRLDKAEESFIQATKLKPNVAEIHANLANVLQKLEKLEDSEKSFKKAISLNPQLAEAHTNLGKTLKDLGKLTEAEASYRKAIDLKPSSSEAFYRLGRTLQECGKLDEAVVNFQHAYAKRTGIRPAGQEELAPAVTSLHFELTNKCNFHCTFCPSDSQTRSIGSMDIELIKKLYQEAANKKLTNIVNLHLMGEPTLHPQLIEILNFGASKKIKTDLVTNGSTLVAKTVPKIIEAMYGTITVSHMTPTQETYQFRGKVGLSWERYISNIRYIVFEYMKKVARGDKIECELVIRVLASQNTAANVTITDTPKEARAILEEWNNFVAETEQELGIPAFKRKDHNDNNLLQENRHKSIYYPLQKGIKLCFWRAFTFANTRVGEDFELQKPIDSGYCPNPFTDVGVLWNGDVTLCGLDHDGELKVGNIKDSSIEAIIQNEEAKKLRACMLGHHPLPPICQKCQSKPVRRGTVSESQNNFINNS